METVWTALVGHGIIRASGGSMAAKRTRTISQRERRRMRIQQIVFVAIGVLALASIIISMVKY